jgi:hypothetical protein
MSWKVLDKLVTKTIKDKFPEQIDEVILSQDDFGEYNGRRLLDTRIIVVLNNYDDLKYEDEIKDYIKTIERTVFNEYLGGKSRITFAMRDN